MRKYVKMLNVMSPSFGETGLLNMVEVSGKRSISLFQSN